MFFRDLFGIPDVFMDARGRAVNGVKGYLHYLLGLVARDQARRVVVAFDESLRTCFRNDIYAPYKANRPPPDDNVKFQLASCRRLTGQLGVLTLADHRYEADDILATLAARARRPVCLHTWDKDLLQLLRPSVTLRAPVSGVVCDATFRQRFGFAPALFPDYQALQGDASDNIPGVPGIGPSRAGRLVAELGSMEAIFAGRREWPRLGLPVASQAHRNLAAQREQAFAFRRLTRLCRRVATSYASADVMVGAPQVDCVARDLEASGLLRYFAKPLALLRSSI